MKHQYRLREDTRPEESSDTEATSESDADSLSTDLTDSTESYTSTHREEISACSDEAINVTSLPKKCRQRIAAIAATSHCVIMARAINRYSIPFLEKFNTPKKPFAIKSHTIKDRAKGARGLISAETLSHSEMELTKAYEDCDPGDFYIASLKFKKADMLQIYGEDVDYDAEADQFTLKPPLSENITLNRDHKNTVTICDMNGKPLQVLAQKGPYDYDYVTCDIDLFNIAPCFYQYHKSTDTGLKVLTRRASLAPLSGGWNWTGGSEDPDYGNESTLTREVRQLDKDMIKHNHESHNPKAKALIGPKITACIPFRPGEAIPDIDYEEVYQIGDKKVHIAVIENQEQHSDLILRLKHRFVFMLNPRWKQFIPYHTERMLRDNPTRMTIHQVSLNKVLLIKSGRCSWAGMTVLNWKQLQPFKRSNALYKCLHLFNKTRGATGLPYGLIRLNANEWVFIPCCDFQEVRHILKHVLIKDWSSLSKRKRFATSCNCLKLLEKHPDAFKQPFWVIPISNSIRKKKERWVVISHPHTQTITDRWLKFHLKIQSDDSECNQGITLSHKKRSSKRVASKHRPSLPPLTHTRATRKNKTKSTRSCEHHIRQRKKKVRRHQSLPSLGEGHRSMPDFYSASNGLFSSTHKGVAHMNDVPIRRQMVPDSHTDHNRPSRHSAYIHALLLHNQNPLESIMSQKIRRIALSSAALQSSP